MHFEGVHHRSGSTRRWPSSASVDPLGRVTAQEGSAASHLLGDDDELLRAVVAVLETEVSWCRFCWPLGDSTEKHQWFDVTVEILPSWPEVKPSILVNVCERKDIYGLTTRELEILTLVSTGLTNTEIGERLYISPRTVSTHVERILEKLGCSTRTEASSLAIQGGLMKLPIPGGADRGKKHPLFTLQAAIDRGGMSSLAPSSTRKGRNRRPYLIGSVVPLTGPSASDGREMLRGLDLAIAEVNERSDTHDCYIEHVVADAEVFDAESISSAFEHLADQEVDAITTGYLFNEEAVLQAARSYPAPLLHSLTAASTVAAVSNSPDLYGHVFQVCPTEEHYGTNFIRFLDGLMTEGRLPSGNRRIAFVETTFQSCQMASNRTLQMAEEHGWDVVQIQHVDNTGADWQEVINALERHDPVAIMVTHFLPEELSSFYQTFVRSGLPALLYAIYTPSIPAFRDACGGTMEGLIWATANGTYSDAIGRRLHDRYLDQFGEAPGRSHAGRAYDTVMMLAQVWSQIDSPRRFDIVASKLRDTIYRGANGVYALGNEGQSGLSYPDSTPDPSFGQAHLVFQVQDGRDVVLSPWPYVESNFREPPWLSALRAA